MVDLGGYDAIGLGELVRRRKFFPAEFVLPDKDVAKLVEFYRKKGFADAAVSYEVDRDAERGSVTARVLIDEGALYDVSIVGNTKIARRNLKKDVVLHKEGNRFEQGLKKSLKKMGLIK